MTTFPPTVTDAEKALLRVLHTKSGGYGRSTWTQRPDEAHIGYRISAAFRGGSVYSPFARFEPRDQVEWACRVLGVLTEDRVGMPQHVALDRNADWTTVRAEIERIFQTAFDTACGEDQEYLDQDGGNVEKFRDWNTHSTIVDGKVTDAWGYSFAASARWFLDNMTPFVLFATFQVVSDAVDDAVADGLLAWAVGETDSDPRKVAEEAFDQAMRALDKHIDAALAADAA